MHSSNLKRMAYRSFAVITVLLLLGAQTLRAETPMIDLSCDGATKLGGDPANDHSEAVKNFGMSINLAQHTVSGFGTIAHVDSADDSTISFSGTAPAWAQATTTTITVTGVLDRVTGAVSATATTANKDKILVALNYELMCKVTRRLF